MRIAILDADAPRAEAIRRALAAGAYHCHCFRRSQTFLLRTRRDTFDLAVIADNPADLPCERVLDRLRERRPPLPIVALTARTAEADVVRILNSGANDCMRMPLRGAELLARVNAQLRHIREVRPPGPGDAIIHFDEHVFDTARRIATVRGVPARLTRKEFDLALLLFRNLSRELSRPYILDLVWECGQGLASRTVDTHASRIRAKLGLIPEHGYMLSSRYSYGYRLERVADAAGLIGAAADGIGHQPGIEGGNEGDTAGAAEVANGSADQATLESAAKDADAVANEACTPPR